MTIDRSEHDVKFISYIKRYAIHIIIILIGLYIIFPVLAPVLMRFGLDKPAKLIYWLYSHLCHQLAYRSWFIFGEEAFFPLSEANVWDGLSYQQAFGLPGSDFDAARSIIGNEIYGYKIALCQRDLAIYCALFFFGLVYLITGKRIKKINIFLWVLLGVIPLGFDGLTQLIKNIPIKTISSIIFRESTPLLRTWTGAAFGFFTGWYIFPSIDSLIRGSEKTN